MKKQSILALALTLALAAAPFTAFAEPSPDDPPPTVREPNANTDPKTPIESPQGGDGTRGDGTQLEGDSYGFAEVYSGSGLTKTGVTGDDSGVDKRQESEDQNADIGVWARVSDKTSEVYKIDIAWGAMRFEFADGTGTWDPDEHAYVGSKLNGTETEGEGEPEEIRPHWVNSDEWTVEIEKVNTVVGGYSHYDEETGGLVLEETYGVGADGTNNRITVTNHSNGAVNARFDYKMLPTLRKEENGKKPGGAAATPFNDGYYDDSQDFRQN
jgi:hypothetical protein